MATSNEILQGDSIPMDDHEELAAWVLAAIERDEMGAGRLACLFDAIVFRALLSGTAPVSTRSERKGKRWWCIYCHRWNGERRMCSGAFRTICIGVRSTPPAKFDSTLPKAPRGATR